MSACPHPCAYKYKPIFTHSGRRLWQEGRVQGGEQVQGPSAFEAHVSESCLIELAVHHLLYLQYVYSRACVCAHPGLWLRQEGRVQEGEQIRDSIAAAAYAHTVYGMPTNVAKSLSAVSEDCQIGLTVHCLLILRCIYSVFTHKIVRACMHAPRTTATARRRMTRSTARRMFTRR